VPTAASAEYLTRLSARRASRDALMRAEARIAHARLATFFLGCLLTLMVWRFGLGPWWLILPVGVFGWLVRRHSAVIRSRESVASGVAFYERGLARIEDRWIGQGETGDRFKDDRHPYASDLDLFGRGSLFELLSLALTRAGEETLARWLTTPAGAAEIRARQQAVEELTAALDLREDLAVSGTDIRETVRTDRLLTWADSPMPAVRRFQVCTWTLTAGLAAAAIYMTVTGQWWPLGLGLLLAAGVFHAFQNLMASIVTGQQPATSASFVADTLSHRTKDLGTLADLLHSLERASFRSERLLQLRGALTADGRPASRLIRQLHRLAEMHDSERSAAVVPVGLFLLGQLELALGVAMVLQLLRPHVTLAVQRWRQRYGGRVRAWLGTIAEFEAFMSLSAFRFEHGDPFPEVVSTDGAGRGPAIFEGRQLGHPLLPAAVMVPNDVELDGGPALLVVSGSNMSGKSTLLRTVGANAVLALAGAPVRAASLRISPLSIGATLRIQDSLIEGRSRFAAEIARIRTLSDIADGPMPLLFLLDELFHGTNSHDRLVGATGVLRSLLDRGALGLTTTHDLALTAIADGLGSRAANVHFQDWLDGTEMRFDYRMKPGPVTRSNALALMRAVGLEVAEPS
jgi:hypothetical protein